jgi:hypothetical protein
MKYIIVLIGSLCCATASDNRIGSAHIVNDTDHTLNAEIGIPKRCQADVTITKIDAQEALFKAIRKDSVQGVRNAVRDGADVDQMIQDKTPLMWAIMLKRVKAATELIHLGATVDVGSMRMIQKIQNKAPLVWAVSLNRLQVAPEILQPGVVVDTECARELIKKGFFLDHRVSFGMTLPASLCARVIRNVRLN